MLPLLGTFGPWCYQIRFIWPTGPKLKMRFTAEKEYTDKAIKRGDWKTSLWAAPWRCGGGDIYGRSRVVLGEGGSWLEAGGKVRDLVFYTGVSRLDVSAYQNGGAEPWLESGIFKSSDVTRWGLRRPRRLSFRVRGLSLPQPACIGQELTAGSCKPSGLYEAGKVCNSRENRKGVGGS